MHEKCDVLLLSLLGNSELVELWWRTQNRAFQFETPTDVFVSQPEKVLAYLLGMLNGDYS